MNRDLQKIQTQINNYKTLNPNNSLGELSDTYHTFNNLYDHRTVLLALALMKMPYAWKTTLHEDGTMFDGMFLVGAPTPCGMISYHCENKFWKLFKIPVIPHSPEFDGYTEEDVLDRIEKFILGSGTKLINPQNIDEIENLVQEKILPVFGDDLIGQAAYIGFYNA